MHGRTTPPRGPRSALDKARPILFTVLVPIVVLAMGSLIMEYGFRITPYGLRVLHYLEVAALGILMVDPVLRLMLAKDRWALVRYRWFEFATALAFIVFVAAMYGLKVYGARHWALVAAQVAIILVVGARLVELNQYLVALKVRPALLLAGSFLTLIAIGTGLLLLPAATAAGQPPTTFMDALFTAASAVCVTGLTVVDTGSHWSLFGQYVMLALIQLGGLGLMTAASVMALLLWRGLRVRESLLVQEVFSHDLRTEVRRIVFFIIVTTFSIEAVGAVLLMDVWQTSASGGVLSLGERIYYSVFHSTAAFCNAGFSLYSGNLVKWQSSWEANLVIPALILSGGIGFGVLYNLARMVRYVVIGRKKAPLAKKRLMLQTKLALVMTAVLLLGGTALVLVLEMYPGQPDAWVCSAYATPPQAPGSPPVLPEAAAPAAESPLGRTWTERLSGAWFLSVTARTAGFNTVDVTRLASATKFLVVVLMFIGASPGSTGGGIKTVTLAVIACGVWAALRGYPHVQVFKRALPYETVLRAMAILAVCVTWVSVVAMIISAWGMQAGSHYTFLDVLFETTSGFATVGLSAGATPLLNTLGRLLIVLTMFLGRVGPLTLFVAMQGRRVRPRFSYATENVAIS